MPNFHRTHPNLWTAPAWGAVVGGVHACSRGDSTATGLWGGGR